MRFSNRMKAIGAGLVLALAAPSQAAVTITIDQIGNDVVTRATGALDLTGMTFLDIFSGGAGIFAEYGYVTFGQSGTRVAAYEGASGPENLGVPIGPSGGTTLATSASGTSFGVTGDLPFKQAVYVPEFYKSGDDIDSLATYAGMTFETLKLKPGRYVWTLPFDNITVRIGLAAGGVPEPSVWAMMIGGVGAIGGALRTRRRRETSQLA